MHVEGLISGDLYLVERERGAYHGVVGADGALGGLYVDRSEQHTIGASNGLLNMDMKARADPDAARSDIRFVRLEAGATCARLLAQRQKVFPP